MPDKLIRKKISKRQRSQQRADVGWAIAISAAFLFAVLLAFGRTFSHGFSGYDDSIFIHGEPHVARGLTWSGTVWAFTNGPLGEWYPLSMLSHMLDCQLYGLEPAGHHATNVLLHASAAVILFLALWRMTAGLWPSALAAALFALHPLRVESVAWLSERRDVLSGLFFALTLVAYAEYVRRPRSLPRYLAVAVALALGLMSKATLVMAPVVLLLLDYWPLGRIGGRSSSVERGNATPQTANRESIQAGFSWHVIVEKLPLLALAAGDAAMTMRSHAKFPDPVTMPERISNAAISCVAYLGQTFVPVGLSAYYSHPEGGWPVWQVAAAATLLLAISVAAVIGRRGYPYVFVGWFWYLAMLVPVLGLTSVAGHSRADRYTYLAQIGIDLGLAWSAMRWAGSLPARRRVLEMAAAAILVGLAAVTWRQTGFWQDDRTLWEHAIACDPTNVTAHYSLGTALEHKDDRAAAEQYSTALQMGPTSLRIYRMLRAKAHYALGNITNRSGNTADARKHYAEAITAYPEYKLALMALGILLAKTGKLDEAMIYFDRSIELDPGNADIYATVAIHQSEGGRTDAAIANYEKALTLNPNIGMAQTGLAVLLAQRGDVAAAILHFRAAIQIDPDLPLSYHYLARLLREQGETREAAQVEQRGRQAGHRFAAVQIRGGEALARQGKTSEAMAQFRHAVAAAPDDVPAHLALADALAAQGNREEAAEHYRRALAIDPNCAVAKTRLGQLGQ